MKIVVTGGRLYGVKPVLRPENPMSNYEYEQHCALARYQQGRLLRVLDLLHQVNPITVLAQGGAKGADALAYGWCKEHGVEVHTYNADWKVVTGPMRNRTMIDRERPDLVVAFPGGSGTANCVRYARSQRVSVLEVEP